MRWAKMLTIMVFLGGFPGVVLADVSDDELAQLVFEKAEIYELERDWEKALDYYEKANELNANESYRYKAAYAATQCKPPRWELAESLLNRNRDVNSLLLLADISRQRRRWEKSLKLLLDARNQSANDPRVNLLWGQCAYDRYMVETKSSDAEMAISYYRRFLRQAPNSHHRIEVQERLRELEHGEAGKMLNMAITVLRNGEFSRAWQFLDEAEKRSPNWTEISYWRGCICGYRDPKKKEECSEGYWRQAESLPEARLALANLYRKQEKLQQALQEAHAVVEKEQGWVPPLFLLGQIHQELGNYPEARGYFQMVADFVPDSVEAEQAERMLRIKTDLPKRSGDEELDLQRFVEEYGPEVEDTEVLRRLDEIISRLHRHNGLANVLPQVYLLANEHLNAWSMPPDSLFVTTGLVEFVDRNPNLRPIADDVLAFILGHEWVHILQNDYKRSEKIRQLVSELLPEQSVPWVRIRSSLGRAAEVNADRQGLLFAYRSGYNPYASIEWCKAIIQAEGDWDTNGDHPSLEERQQLLRSLLEGSMREAYESFERGVHAFKDGNLERAARAFEVYLRLFPNDGAALENLCILYFLRGASVLPRVPWAPWHLSHDIKTEPELEDFPSRFIAIPDEALRWWNRARRQAHILLHLNPDCAGVYQVLGDISLASGDSQRAEDMYRRGLTIDLSHAGLKNSLGVLYACRGELTQAFEFWNSVQGLSAAAWNLTVKHSPKSR